MLHANHSLALSITYIMTGHDMLLFRPSVARASKLWQGGQAANGTAHVGEPVCFYLAAIMFCYLLIFCAFFV